MQDPVGELDEDLIVMRVEVEVGFLWGNILSFGKVSEGPLEAILQDGGLKLFVGHVVVTFLGWDS
jgi:hypothetical protein